jgi:preprotein translocase subunit SecF
MTPGRLDLGIHPMRPGAPPPYGLPMDTTTSRHRAVAPTRSLTEQALLGAVVGLLVVGVYVGWRLVIHTALAAAH